MFRDQKIVLIIPALDEEEAIGPVVEAVDRAVVDRVIVVDNGSSDQTSKKAKEAGAEVLSQPRRGYGSACLTGIAAANDADVLVFLDGDGSDNPGQIPDMLEFMIENQADLVVGSRVLGSAEPGALTPLQAFGNALTCTLVRFFWGVSYTDLGPFRAIDSLALARLGMTDPDFGWTIAPVGPRSAAHSWDHGGRARPSWHMFLGLSFGSFFEHAPAAQITQADKRIEGQIFCQ